MEPSATARRVAAQRLTFERVTTPYGLPDADDRLARDVAGGLADDGPLRDYLQARTRFFDRAVVSAIDSGVRQVVVGAAGYDGRAWRYAKEGVSWFELDHPATQEDKVKRVEALALPTDHVRFVAADFSVDALEAPLLSMGFEPSVPSLFTLEGVAVYLDRPVLESVLDQIGALAAAGSRLAISLSVSGRSPGTDERRDRFRAAVAALGEPARSAVDPDEVEPMLGAAGWRVVVGNAAGSERARLAGLVLAEPA